MVSNQSDTVLTHGDGRDDVPSLHSRCSSSSTLASTQPSQKSKVAASSSSSKSVSSGASSNEKTDTEAQATVVADSATLKWSDIFGGPTVKIGSRLQIRTTWFARRSSSVSEPDKKAGKDVLQDQINQEDDSEIQYRTCSWPKTAALLFAEYIGLAIMCFPATYSELGWVGGVIATILNAVFYQYTSLILWRLCLRHPEVRDICDIGQLIFGGPEAWWITAVMFVLNNVFVMGLHVVVGGEYVNTVATNWNTGICKTVLFCFMVSIACWVCSLPRTFSVLSHLATASAVLTFLSVVTAAVFLQVQGHPADYTPEETFTNKHGHVQSGGEPIFSAWPAVGATFSSVVVALMNISYTFIGQITLPSFIAEMKDPRDFPKALWACTASQVFVFTAIGLSIYKYTGTQYMSSPAYGGLQTNFKIISFSLMIPSIIILGALYASVTGRFFFFRFFQNTRHLTSHTKTGWTSWGTILMVIWIMAFFVSQVIPFFSGLLAIVAAVFDTFFGFLYWAVAWFRMRSADVRDKRPRNRRLDIFLIGFNVLVTLIGLGLFLGAGTYASVIHIQNLFTKGDLQGAFSCASTAL